MIIEFTAVDLTSFTGYFNGHGLQIFKQPTGDWRLFVDFIPVRNGLHASPRDCMKQAEAAAHNILAKKMIKKGD